MLSPSGGWDVQLIKHNFSNENVIAILQIPLGFSRRDDSVLWHYKDSGGYLVKNGYQVGLFMESNLSSSNPICLSFWWKCLWKMTILLKIKIFV